MYEIKNLSLEEKVGQMLIFAFHGIDYNNQISAFVNELKIGGIIFFYRNIESINQVALLNKRIQNETRIPFFIGLDQEGGSVLRITEGITPLPGAMALASTPVNEIYDITKAVGDDLKNLGFNLNFAPVADINTNPFNPVINSRSYGDDPKKVAHYATCAAMGFQDALVCPFLKHFPGHGNTCVDSHIGLPRVNASKADLVNNELVPYRHAIAAGIEGIMTAHILYPGYDKKYPASLSYKLITKLLKKQMGFTGIICTDSLTMGAISKNYSIRKTIRLAVNAGNDLLIFCGEAKLEEQRAIYNVFLDLVKRGKIPLKRVNESVSKILRYKAKYQKGKINTAKVAQDTSVLLGQRLQQESITLVKDGGLLPLKVSDKVLMLFPKLEIASLVDNEKQDYKSLGNYLPFEERIISPNVINKKDIIAINKQYDKIVLATYNVRIGDWQQELFSFLDKEKTIVVSLRSPYDALHLHNINTYICIYEGTENSLKSLALCLSGKNPFLGKLPISLKGLD